MLDKPNYELRREELSLAGFSRPIVDWADGPHREVIKDLKNRSGWFSLHDTWELAKLETDFQIVYCDAAFRPSIDAFANGAITRK